MAMKRKSKPARREIVRCLRDCGYLVGLQCEINGFAGDLQVRVYIANGPVLVDVALVGTIQRYFDLPVGVEYCAVLIFLLGTVTCCGRCVCPGEYTKDAWVSKNSRKLGINIHAHPRLAHFQQPRSVVKVKRRLPRLPSIRTAGILHVSIEEVVDPAAGCAANRLRARTSVGGKGWVEEVEVDEAPRVLVCGRRVDIACVVDEVEDLPMEVSKGGVRAAGFVVCSFVDSGGESLDDCSQGEDGSQGFWYLAVHFGRFMGVA